MGKFLIFGLLLILTSCSTPESYNVSKTSLTFADIEERNIQWTEIFSMEENDYLLFFYSPSCGHCLEIEQEIIKFSLSCVEPFYFVKESDDFVISFDINETIGTNDIGHFFILGTPSLVEIKNHKVNKNIAGVAKIRDYIS